MDAISCFRNYLYKKSLFLHEISRLKDEELVEYLLSEEDDDVYSLLMDEIKKRVLIGDYEIVDIYYYEINNDNKRNLEVR